MTTSGVTQLNMTARDIIEFALRQINAIPIGQEVDMFEAAPVLTHLNMMLKDWETKGPHLWRVTQSSIAATANTMSYSLTDDNPLRLKEVRFQYTDGHHLPMEKMSLTRYLQLPTKNSTGTTTQWAFDPQSTSQTLYTWPVLPSVTTERYVFSFQRRFQICQSLNDSVDIPEEWLDTVGYCLCERLLPMYGPETASSQRVERMAQTLLRKAKSFDRPDFVNMVPRKRFR